MLDGVVYLYQRYGPQCQLRLSIESAQARTEFDEDQGYRVQESILHGRDWQQSGEESCLSRLVLIHLHPSPEAPIKNKSSWQRGSFKLHTFSVLRLLLTAAK